jgi:hypothetical protein
LKSKESIVLMLFPFTNLGRSTAGLLLIAFVLAACGSGGDPTNPYHLTADIQGDPSIERTWVEPEVEEVTVLSSGDEYTLYTPNALKIGADGRLYVFDYGNNQIKAFTLEGTYLRTYGKGEGRGPGQMLTMTDLGVWRDSLVYVADPRQRRVAVFDRDTGAFVRHDDVEGGAFRFSRVGNSIGYAVILAPKSKDFLRMTTQGGRQHTISYPIATNVSSLTLGGTLQAREERALYVPRYFPVIFAYAPDDTVGDAYPTPDYGSAPMPEAQRKNGRPIRPPANSAQGGSSLHQGTLTVQREGVDSIEFDVYDADAMTYRHTVRLPIEQDLAVYGRGRAVVAQDTTVHIYRVERSTK